MKVRIINPTINHEWHARTLATYQACASPTTELHLVFLEHGPESVESDYDVSLATPDILHHVLRAESDGADAVVIDCMADPGLFAARELVRIPVVGPAQASMSLAAILADRFSVIGILDRDRPMIHNQWRLYDLQDRGASVRVVDIPVVSLHEDENALVAAAIEQAVLAVSQDQAHAIVLGCTGMGGIARAVQRGLEQGGYRGVPVIDPTGVALKMAESLVALGLSHSKRTFPIPPEKKILGYEDRQRS